MNRMEQLIEELCPEGVEWRTIDDVCNISRGRVMSKDYIRDNSGVYPVYSSQTANDGILGKINTFDYDGEYLTWTTDGAYAGSVFYRKGRFSITNVCGLLEVNNAVLHPKFLMYFLNIVAKRYVSEGMGNPKLMSNAMAKIPLPLPPLPVQQEIVTILDKFSALDASLQAELEARRKQYEHYRNQLLNFEGKEVEWKTLGEVCEIFDGTHQTPKYTNEGIRFVSVENIKALYETKKYISKIDYENLYKIKPQLNDVFMTRIGSIGACAIVDRDEELAFYVTLTLLRPNQNIVKSKFVKFFIESSIGKI